MIAGKGSTSTINFLVQMVLEIFAPPPPFFEILVDTSPDDITPARACACRAKIGTSCEHLPIECADPIYLFITMAKGRLPLVHQVSLNLPLQNTGYGLLVCQTYLPL